MIDVTILLIGLVMYALGMLIALYWDLKWLFMVTGLLWFLPIVMIDNIFIVTFSVVMVVTSAMLGFRKGETDI